jgi:alkaline phosphatase D
MQVLKPILQFKTRFNLPEFYKNKIILGTWDDHDFGVNDGGQNTYSKKESQSYLFDFLDTPIL